MTVMQELIISILVAMLAVTALNVIAQIWQWL
jgi:hypothetical protein